jgi:uncharacterized membrane protein
MLCLAMIFMVLGHFAKIANSSMLEFQFSIIAIVCIMFGPFKGLIFISIFVLLKFSIGYDT